MIPDIRFEAAFLRAALLVGLIRERDVIAWADVLVAAEAEPYSLLVDVSLARPELTTIREALGPLAEASDDAPVGGALLSFIANDPDTRRLDLRDRVQILGQLCRERLIASKLSAPIERFADRLMLASAGISVHERPTDFEMHELLGAMRSPSFYRLSTSRRDESAALLAALSRKLDRERRFDLGAEPGRAWVLVNKSEPTLIVNEPLWCLAVDAFSPLPLSSRIPYAGVPDDAIVVLDESTADSMGIVEAAERLEIELVQ